MELVVWIEILVLLGVVGLLLWHYAASYVSVWVLAIVFISWLSCFSIVLILPLDIFHSTNGDPNRMLNMWRVIYWVTFLLAWIVLPLLTEFEEAGEFTPKARFTRALRNNLIFYVVVIAIGILGIVYLAIRGSVTFSSILTYAMATGNCVGLLLLVILLAHGITQLPKQCWRMRSLQMMHRSVLYRLAQTREKVQELFYSIEEKVADLKYGLQKGKFAVECRTILECVPETIVKKALESRSAELSESSLVQTHKEVKFIAREYIRLYEKQKDLLQEGLLMQDIIKSKDNPDQVIQTSLLNQSSEWVRKARWIWHCKLKRWGAIGLMVLTISLAVLVIIAQISIFIPKVQKGNPIAIALSSQNESFVKVNLVALPFLGYICYCVYSSLFEIKLAGYYGLYPNRQTDGPSLLFSAINCTRVTYAICYNFLQLGAVQSSSFTSLMGRVDIFPVFGANFRYVFPILLLVLIFMNSFDLYSKILSRLGLGRFVFSEDFAHEKIQEGRKQLALARQSANNSVLNRRTTDLKLFKAFEQIQVFLSQHESTRLLEAYV